MNSEIRILEPKVLWNAFTDLNAVPRPSKKEERVIGFVKNFGTQLGLETLIDKVGNVLIKKPATKGLEGCKTVVLQSHLDMVHQKNEDTVFDFDTQGIEMYTDGDWVKAKGTTLGADNGIGVATIMAILASDSIEHPALEALFTIDEETGMTGAMELSPNWLTGEILLNLDTEEDDEIGIGCAGGIDLTAELRYEEEVITKDKVAYTISVTGLCGGHSGVEIHKGLGNANKIMNRLLYEGYEKYGLQIGKIVGGSLRNAIPRESFATVVIDKGQEIIFERDIKKLKTTIQKEFGSLEPDLQVILEITTMIDCVLPIEIQQNVLHAVYALHDGVYRMSPDIPDLVMTSNNVAKVTIGMGTVRIDCLTRSSVCSSRIDMEATLSAVLRLSGFTVTADGEYPGWTPDINSPILEVLEKVYFTINGEKARVAACHAGLECGILGQHYPDMDMISFGPTIRGAHSPDERVSISSVQKYWNFVLKILTQIPLKA